MWRDTKKDTGKGSCGEGAVQLAHFILTGQMWQTTFPWVEEFANQCFVLLFIAFTGLGWGVGGRIKSCLVFILKGSQKSKTSFLLFLGGSGGRSESSFYAHNGCSGAMADLTFHSGFLCSGGPEQGCCLWTAPSPRLFSSAKLSSMSWRR